MLEQGIEQSHDCGFDRRGRIGVCFDQRQQALCDGSKRLGEKTLPVSEQFVEMPRSEPGFAADRRNGSAIGALSGVDNDPGVDEPLAAVAYAVLKADSPV